MNMMIAEDPRSQTFTVKDIFNSEHKVYVIQDIKHVLKEKRVTISSQANLNIKRQQVVM